MAELGHRGCLQTRRFIERVGHPVRRFGSQNCPLFRVSFQGCRARRAALSIQRNTGNLQGRVASPKTGAHGPPRRHDALRGEKGRCCPLRAAPCFRVSFKGRTPGRISCKQQGNLQAVPSRTGRRVGNARLSQTKRAARGGPCVCFHLRCEGAARERCRSHAKRPAL